jgi:hypothetical protein
MMASTRRRKLGQRQRIVPGQTGTHRALVGVRDQALPRFHGQLSYSVMSRSGVELGKPSLVNEEFRTSSSKGNRNGRPVRVKRWTAGLAPWDWLALVLAGNAPCFARDLVRCDTQHGR